MEQKEIGQKEHKKQPKGTNLYNIFIGLSVILAIVLLLNVAATYKISSKLAKDREDAIEKAKPAKISLLEISDSKCTDCFDMSVIISAVKELNVNITSDKKMQPSLKEAKDLIAKYQIEKLPALIVTGETGKISLEIFDKKDDALVFAQPSAPYVNVSTGNIAGRVTIYHLKDASCEKCSSLLPLISEIKASGVKIASEKSIDISSAEGKSLISKYSIDFAPSIILSKDADAYMIMKQAWPQIGTQEKDGSFVMRTPYPPMKNLTTGKVAGLVKIIYLTDSSCTECYNVSTHKDILTSPQSYSIKINSEEAYDISNAKGKELLLKYSITQVPTVILSSDVNAYSSTASLKQFFSAENDGSFVFRKLSVVGAYKDLASGQVINPQQAQQ